MNRDEQLSKIRVIDEVGNYDPELWKPLEIPENKRVFVGTIPKGKNQFYTKKRRGEV